MKTITHYCTFSAVWAKITKKDFTRQYKLCPVVEVNGKVWFVDRPENQVSFDGKFELMQGTSESVESYADQVLPKSLLYAIDNGEISNRFTNLIYDKCSPTVAAYVYIGRN